MEPLFTVNPKKENPENSNIIQKNEMTLCLRTLQIYLEGVYVFDNDKKLTSPDMELHGKKLDWLNFFSAWVWPTLKKSTSNKEELILSDEMFLEILYKRLWPATEMDFKELFEEHNIDCKWCSRGENVNITDS
jgi:hypothetical protein